MMIFITLVSQKQDCLSTLDMFLPTAAFSFYKASLPGRLFDLVLSTLVISGEIN
jgi:hypothetical protein